MDEKSLVFVLWGFINFKKLIFSFFLVQIILVSFKIGFINYCDENPWEK
jgi:hypothetical protein